MATYAIGDIHGCFEQLQRLLDHIKYNSQHDTLWFTGDLVNGGPQPTETLRFIKDLGDKAVCVLGNHDLTLLAVASGKLAALNDRAIGYDAVFAAADRDTLLDWLRTLPLTHYDAEFNALLVHAGVLPTWDLTKIQQLSREVETLLRSTDIEKFYAVMHGDLPDTWSDTLTGIDRVRFIINTLTRMRFCNAAGSLALKSKGEAAKAPDGYAPWFTLINPSMQNTKIIFGHWAALLGETGVPNAFAIDTGCVWGNSLTALRLNDWRRFSIPAL